MEPSSYDQLQGKRNARAWKRQFKVAALGKGVWDVFNGIYTAVSLMFLPDRLQNQSEGCYITGLILYEGFFGSYACLTWVLPAEVYPTYLRSYGMETSDVTLFFCSWLVTYFFSDMQAAMSRIGLTLGFYGGIAVVGWFYQLAFMPETKNKTLEEIDILFSQPTSQLVKQNLKGVAENLSDLAHGRWGRVFRPSPESPLPEIHSDTSAGPMSHAVQG